jgi:formylglycine-generating enzyme required for sulfatase activity
MENPAMTFLRRLLGTKGPDNEQPTGKTCPSCGQRNPLEVKFCSSCGSEFLVVSDRFDAFISYRRETGSDLASLLKIQLENRFHKQIFLDINELQVGRFDEELLRRIEVTANFILILSRASLDRCANKSDWLKREIMHALETGRNIIPIFTEGFTFPTDEVWALLPPEMRVLPSLNGVTYSHIHQDSAIRKIASYMKTESEMAPAQVNPNPEVLQSPPSGDRFHTSQPDNQMAPTVKNESIQLTPPEKQEIFPKVEPLDAKPASIRKETKSISITTHSATGSGNKSAAQELEIITNEKDGTKLVLIPEGKFWAGSRREGEGGRPFQVYLPSIYLAVFTVTNAQYAQFLTEINPGQKDLDEWIGLGQYRFIQMVGDGFEASGEKDDHPIVGVSWYGAQAYCEWAGLRLPTELEWEKGARGTDGREFPWGNEPVGTRCRWSGTCHHPETTCAVDSYREGISPWGLYQMIGNVQQWCSDEYDPTAYDRYRGGDFSPPRGIKRVARGSYWNEGTGECLRCAYRSSSEPDRVFGNSYGFRCAKTP